jgi:calcineurin-like phosphoesterase family protein
MSNVWTIADTHFHHANIIKYCDRPKNHDELMLINWKRMVGPLDTIYHLGDFALTDKETTTALKKCTRTL